MSRLLFPKKSHRKSITTPPNSEKLAEFMGIIFGDGGINNEWQLVISLNSIKDKEFSYYIINLIKELFEIDTAVRKRPNQNTLVLVCSSMNLLDFLVSKGAVKGNKIARQIDIPRWIRDNNKLERAFVRGMMDTDGGLYVHNHIVRGKHYRNIGLCFSSFSAPLITTIASIFEKNGIKPYIKNNKTRIYLYSSEEVKKYLEIFGSHNSRIEQQYNLWRDARAV